jgi:mycothiol synthase
MYCFSRKAENTQLQMLQMQLKNLNNVPKPPELPSGYLIRTYLNGDESDWVRIINESFGKSYEPPEITIKNIITAPDFDIQSLFFITYNDYPVGTVCAVTLLVGWMKIGFIHMVAVSPEHRGKRLGLTLTYASLQYFKKKGIKQVILYTDDSRIQAINIYRKLGFKPLDIEPDHKERWEKIFKKEYSQTS